MKTWGTTWAGVFLFLALSPAFGEQALEQGKRLFATTELGKAGKSCASCHPHGKGLEEIDAYDDGMLKEMINFCIRDALKGPMLQLDSRELEAMRVYLRSL